MAYQPPNHRNSKRAIVIVKNDALREHAENFADELLANVDIKDLRRDPELVNYGEETLLRIQCIIRRLVTVDPDTFED